VGTATFTSKRGRSLTHFETLAEEARDQLRLRYATLDGEILAFDSRAGRTSGFS
jgi:ATP-dependent DNA ligase